MRPGALQRQQMPFPEGNRDANGDGVLTRTASGCPPGPCRSAPASTCGTVELLESPPPPPTVAPASSVLHSGWAEATLQDAVPEDPAAASTPAAAGRRFAPAAAVEAAAAAAAAVSSDAASGAGDPEPPTTAAPAGETPGVEAPTTAAPAGETPGVEETAEAAAISSGAWTGRPILAWPTVLV
jgi:hypothetical protein